MRRYGCNVRFDCKTHRPYATRTIIVIKYQRDIPPLSAVSPLVGELIVDRRRGVGDRNVVKVRKRAIPSARVVSPENGGDPSGGDRVCDTGGEAAVDRLHVA